MFSRAGCPADFRPIAWTILFNIPAAARDCYAFALLPPPRRPDGKPVMDRCPISVSYRWQIATNHGRRIHTFALLPLPRRPDGKPVMDRCPISISYRWQIATNHGRRIHTFFHPSASHSRIHVFRIPLPPRFFIFHFGSRDLPIGVGQIHL